MPNKRKRYSAKKNSAFSSNVQAKRLERGLTQEQLGNALGLSKTRISEIEAGVFPTDPDRIWQLADALGCTCDELLRPKE